MMQEVLNPANARTTQQDQPFNNQENYESK